MSKVHLVASAWTTAGDAAPMRGDETSPHSLRERIEAASSAGFRGFGLLHPDLIAARDRYGYAEMRVMFEYHGLVDLELEFLVDWWAEGARREASDSVRRDFLVAAEALGVHHIKAAPELGTAVWDEGRWTEAFADLAAEAGGVGAKVSLEFLPMFNIRTLKDALGIVESAAHDAGGVLIDLWHVARTGTPLSEVSAIPGHLIAGVELDDAAGDAIGSLWEDTIHKRRLCGAGDLDVPAFINAVRATGWDGPWGVEILSEVERQRPIDCAVADAFSTTMDQFALADRDQAIASAGLNTT
jgi:sugar phosphate isomerase/epimerase